MLPPGRARLATRPLPTGSPAVAKTMGMIDVACFVARVCGVPDVTMTLTLSRTNSAALWAARSARPSDQRYSIAMVRPSVQPSSRSRCTKAATHSLAAERVLWPKKPMVGSLSPCCARTASGQATAAPPSSVMNSRLFTRSPRRRGRESRAVTKTRAPWRFEVDGQLEFDRLFHREVGGLGALQNSVHVASCAPEQVWLARAVRHQSPGANVLAQLIHCPQSALRHEVNDPCDTGLVEGFAGHRERIGALLRHCCECGRELDARAHASRDDGHTQPRWRTLSLFELEDIGGVVWIPEKRYARDGWNNLLENLQPLGTDVGTKNGVAGDISSWSGEAWHEPGAHGIAD